MTQLYNRRNFLQTFSAAAAGAGITAALPFKTFASAAEPLRIGIIGCDTSHAVAFTKSFNSATPIAGLEGLKVTAAFAQASPDIENNLKRLPGFVEELKKLGVEMTASIDELINRVDVVMVESNDGRPHLQQALPALKAGKKVFIDKPLAASLAEGMTIFDTARKYNAPVFSASALRFMESAQAVATGSIGKVLGADTFSPCHLEKTHPDIFWYGIHGVETLFTVMGPGCRSVSRTHTDDTDVIVGVWEDGRIGTFRGSRSGKPEYGGSAFGEKGNATLGPFKGYAPLVLQIAEFFRTGKPPVQEAETLEILAFMEAADESKKQNGASVLLETVMRRAKGQQK